MYAWIWRHLPGDRLQRTGLVLAALVTLVVALSLSTVGQAYLTVLADKWHSFTFWLSGVT